MASEDSSAMERLLGIMRRLRSDQGCPWDREQTLESLKPYLVEEAYEVLDAIDDGDPRLHEEELGDLLLQVVFQAQLREEEGAFDFQDVARTIGDKLVRRHPHVFGDVAVADSDEVLRNWEAIKDTEKAKPASAVDGVPRHLPALFKAEKVQRKAARVGFDWDEVGPVMAKVREELAELHEAMERSDEGAVREELGDLLFSVVNLGRFLGHPSEEALNQTVRKFTDRFKRMEERLQAEGRQPTDCSLDEMDRHWDRCKEDERS